MIVNVRSNEPFQILFDGRYTFYYFVIYTQSNIYVYLINFSMGSLTLKMNGEPFIYLTDLCSHYFY